MRSKLSRKFKVTQNGNSVYFGNIGGFTLPTSGEISIMLSNLNVKVDDVVGINTTKFTYNASQNNAPPTLQMLQFRNSENVVTDRFSSASHGTVRLSAGDFQYNSSNFAMDYIEGNTVEFSYNLSSINKT